LLVALIAINSGVFASFYSHAVIESMCREGWPMEVDDYSMSLWYGRWPASGCLSSAPPDPEIGSTFGIAAAYAEITSSVSQPICPLKARVEATVATTMASRPPAEPVLFRR
jgi:hypothetical protein